MAEQLMVRMCNYMYKIMEMCTRKEWADKFEQNKSEIVKFFDILNDISEEKLHENIARHGDYILGQLSVFFCANLFCKRVCR